MAEWHDARHEHALEKVRPSLQADGFDLRLGSPGDAGDVEVLLEAKSGSCTDCLVPDATLVAILEAAFHREDAPFRRVILTKLGFPGHAQATAH
jgi:Fe-S cluster biogenesis protein NfuA